MANSEWRVGMLRSSRERRDPLYSLFAIRHSHSRSERRGASDALG